LEAEDAFFAAGAAAPRRNYRAAKVWPKDELSPLNNDQRCAFRAETKSGFGT